MFSTKQNSKIFTHLWAQMSLELCHYLHEMQSTMRNPEESMAQQFLRETGLSMLCVGHMSR